MLCLDQVVCALASVTLHFVFAAQQHSGNMSYDGFHTSFLLTFHPQLLFAVVFIITGSVDASQMNHLVDKTLKNCDTVHCSCLDHMLEEQFKS